MPDYLLPAAKDAIRVAMQRTGLSRTEVINRAIIAWPKTLAGGATSTEPVPTEGVLTTVKPWRFVRAYRILRTVAERHTAAGHDVEFVAVNEGRMVLRCRTCSPGD